MVLSRRSQSAETETLEGTIKSVIFQNKESHFTILTLAPEGNPQAVPVKVLCYLDDIRRDLMLQAQGVTENDPKWGRQFRAHVCSYKLPATREGIVRFLSSSLIRGIGKTYAERLVAQFGEDLFRVIKQEPDRLKEVAGLGQKRIERLRNSLAAQNAIRNIMVFLMGYGIGIAKAKKIRDIYGDDAVNVIKRNPYKLIDDVDGIGFLSADAIALHAGIELDNPFRLRAGLIYAARQLTEKVGHTCFPKRQLLHEAASLLRVEEALLEPVFEKEIEAVHLILEDIPMPFTVSLPRMHRAEVSVAQNLLRLAEAPGNAKSLSLAAQVLPAIEEKMGFRLSGGQREAVVKAASSKVMVITGGPGTGKTTVVRSIIQILSFSGLTLELAAPTGRAAKRLAESSGKPAKTIHRLLAYNASENRFRFNKDNPLEADAVIVDECSMLDVVLAQSLLEALDSHTRLILVGDVDQLPSIGAGCVLDDIIRSGRFPVVRLSEIFRQSDRSMIPTAAQKIKNGMWPPFASVANPNPSADFYFIEAANEEIQQIVTDLCLSIIPQTRHADPVKDIQVLCPTKKGVAGTVAVNSFIGRAGFAAGLKCPNNKGDIYLHASAVHEFAGDAEITGGNGSVYKIDGDDTWFEYGLGANFNLSKSAYVWADVQRTSGAELDEDWRVNLGVRYSF